MQSYVTAQTIRTLREQKGITQKQLADAIAVSDKTVSKWETGKGLPDISLLAPLAEALSVSVSELLAGQVLRNKNASGNLLRGSFYVCPVCGNVIYALGQGDYSCCGIRLPALAAETAAEDDGHIITLEDSDGDLFVTLSHPMEKDHYISFVALVQQGRMQLVKFWPQQNAEARFALQRTGTLFVCCNRHGLFAKKI
ncbi:MAG: helix-turn-helix domain-containing protein [Oscillospiraceae bacterium]|nr:helix-turn-helix domain-containing protein [Oscillospiraceae bacterium]